MTYMCFRCRKIKPDGTDGYTRSGRVYCYDCFVKIRQCLICFKWEDDGAILKRCGMCEEDCCMVTCSKELYKADDGIFCRNCLPCIEAAQD